MVINIHGFAIKCQSHSDSVTHQLTRPFKYFYSKDAVYETSIVIKETEPPYDSFPDLESVFSTPRNIVYRGGAFKIVDYFGRGAIVEDPSTGQYTLYSRDRNLLQEAFYLLVLSLFGQYCDRQGMLRIHALGLSYEDTAFLLPILPGGGKSTLAAAMLQDPGFKLISDDEPVLNRKGQILPFPLRIGVSNPERLRNIPPEYIYSIDRMEFGRKYFIDCDYWQAQLQHGPLRDIVLFTSRTVLRGPPSIAPVSKRRLLATLWRDAVIGMGLYQGLEFLLQHSSGELAGRLPILAKRAALALRLTAAARCFQFVLSRDVAKNQQLLQTFITTRAFKR